MKETGTTHWLSPNTGADNSSGFTALPGGERYSDGSSQVIGVFGYWWSSTEVNTSVAWQRFMSYFAAYAGRTTETKRSGLSVRCVRD